MRPQRKGSMWWLTFSGRCLVIVGVPIQLWLLTINDGWWVLPNVVMLVVIAIVGVRTERRAREYRQRIWDRAAAAQDPVGYLAGASYIDKLKLSDLLEFMEWMSTHDISDPDDLITMPPVVAGYLNAIASPPRE